MNRDWKAAKRPGASMRNHVPTTTKPDTGSASSGRAVVTRLLALQREAGNRAVTELLGGPEATPTLLVDDEMEDLQPDQVRKSEFLDRLQAAICAELNDALESVGRSSQGCPYLTTLFDHYRQQSAVDVERTLHRYAPKARNAGSAAEYIALVLPRVRQPVEHWVLTGEITGVPEDAPPPAAALLATARGDGNIGNAEGADTAVQRKARPGGDAHSSRHPAVVLGQLGAGQPLNQTFRTRMEPVFDTSFEQVRAHTDATAGRLAAAEGARAFTVGQHMAFGSGEYQPGTPVGDALIAHELAHVTQQAGEVARRMAAPGRDATQDDLEEAADRSAVHAVVSLWARDKDHRLGSMKPPVLARLRTGLRLQSCRKSEESKKRPHEYHGAGGWLHANVYEPLQEDYSGWIRWGSGLADEWGEKVPVGGHVAGSVVGFVPWVLGNAGKMVVSVPQFVTPKSEEEHFLFVAMGGTGPAVVRAGEGVKYGAWWVKNLFKKKPELEKELLEVGKHTVDDVVEEAAKRAPAKTRNITAKKATAAQAPKGKSKAGGKGGGGSKEFFRTASQQELVEFVGGADRLKQMSRQLNAAVGSAKGADKRTIAVGLVREGPGHPPRLVYTASGNRGGGKVEQTAEKLGITRWSISDDALRAKGRASGKHPHIPGAPGDAEQRLIEAADQNGMEVIAAVPSRSACPDCVEALSAEGILLINP